MRKEAICIICKNQELFLSLKRALKAYFPDTHYYFYDIDLIEEGNFDNIPCTNFKKAGVLIAFFMHDEENEKTSQFIKYLRIKRNIRFPLIFCSSLKEEVLNELYGIFGFGISMNKYKSSNVYITIPLELTNLRKAISGSTPLSDVNYEFFIERFSGRHVSLYNDKIKPLMEELQQASFKSQEYFSVIGRIEQLIYEMIGITKRTCHYPIPSDEGKTTLGQRLINAIEGLKNKQDEVEKLKLLMDQWLELVTNKTFE